MSIHKSKVFLAFVCISSASNPHGILTLSIFLDLDTSSSGIIPLSQSLNLPVFLLFVEVYFEDTDSKVVLRDCRTSLVEDTATVGSKLDVNL